ncbi:MAG: phage tail protein I [Cellulosilyticaceae bacterium]
MNNLEDISITNLLPTSIARDGQILASAKAIDNEIAKINALIDKVIIFPHIDKLDSELIDLLAEQFRAPFYDAALSIEKRREIVKNSISWHKKKGTVGAIEEIVTTIFGKSEILEWYEYGGEPHHFRIVTNNINTTEDMVNKFKEAAEHIKRKSSKLDEIVITLTNKFNIFYGFVYHEENNITVRQEA